MVTRRLVATRPSWTAQITLMPTPPAASDSRGGAGSNPATPTKATPKVPITGTLLQALTNRCRLAHAKAYTGTAPMV
jgi:hypothetical protein